MEKPNAICKKTYPDEDDMERYCNGEIDEPCDVRVYIKGGKHRVNPNLYNEEYWELIDPTH